jgi:hypothetical protein
MRICPVHHRDSNRISIISTRYLAVSFSSVSFFACFFSLFFGLLPFSFRAKQGLRLPQTAQAKLCGGIGTLYFQRYPISMFLFFSLLVCDSGPHSLLGSISPSYGLLDQRMQGLRLLQRRHEMFGNGRSDDKARTQGDWFFLAVQLTPRLIKMPESIITFGTPFVTQTRWKCLDYHRVGKGHWLSTDLTGEGWRRGAQEDLFGGGLRREGSDSAAQETGEALPTVAPRLCAYPARPEPGNHGSLTTFSPSRRGTHTSHTSSYRYLSPAIPRPLPAQPCLGPARRDYAKGRALSGRSCCPARGRLGTYEVPQWCVLLTWKSVEQACGMWLVGPGDA